MASGILKLDWLHRFLLIIFNVDESSQDGSAPDTLNVVAR